MSRRAQPPHAPARGCFFPLRVSTQRDAIWWRLVVWISTTPVGQTVTRIFIIRPRT